ncbi:MAG TPA: hypothetical protein DCZ48_02425 [Methylococcaceae bacterium]|nr:hypothetical protein [Methylococcaceae bacterium]
MVNDRDYRIQFAVLSAGFWRIVSSNIGTTLKIPVKTLKHEKTVRNFYKKQRLVNYVFFNALILFKNKIWHESCLVHLRVRKNSVVYKFILLEKYNETYK